MGPSTFARQLAASLGIAAGWLALVGAGGDPIHVEDLVRQALRNNPAAAEAAATAAAQHARAGLVGSGAWPQVTFSTGLTETTSVSQAQTSAQPFALTSAGLAVKQRLFDFGRADADLQGARATAQVASLGAVEKGVEIAFRVRSSYFAWLRARSGNQLATKRVAEAMGVRDQAEAFWKAGKRPKIDLTRAAAALEQARAESARASHTEQAAALAAGVAVGQAEALSGEPILPGSPPIATMPLASLEELARDRHPRLKAAGLRLHAARSGLESARKSVLPELRAEVGYGFRARDLTPGQNWSAGVTLSGPLFDGFGGDRAIEQARAGEEAALAAAAGDRLEVVAAVRQAALAVASARLRIPGEEAALRSAEENLQFATGRYQAGVGSVIEVGDAQTLVAGAENRLADARIDYHLAISDLLRAVGLTGIENADSIAKRHD